jgi:hypothetical protein
MAEERYNIFRSTVHWRYAMARPSLTLVDARLVFFVALFAFHIRWWTFFLLVMALTTFAVAGQLNYSLEGLWRLLKSRIAGRRRPAVPYTRLRPYLTYGDQAPVKGSEN